MRLIEGEHGEHVSCDACAQLAERVNAEGGEMGVGFEQCRCRLVAVSARPPRPTLHPSIREAVAHLPRSHSPFAGVSLIGIEQECPLLL